MRVLLFIAFIGAIWGFTMDIPDTPRTAVQSAGVQYLGQQIVAEKATYDEALAAFEPLNTTCKAAYSAAAENCGACVSDKCKARAKSVCKPSEFEAILADTINFFGSDIPDFFSETVPDFFEDEVGGAFVDLGEGIVDVANDIGSFFEDDFVDAFEDLGGGIEDVVNDVGKFVGNAAGDVADFVVDDIGGVVVDIGEGIGDVVSDIGGGIEDAANEVGDFFDDLFGKRAVNRRGLGDALSDVGEFFEDTAGDVKDFVVDDVGSEVVGFAEDVGDAFTDLGEEIENTFGSIKDGVEDVVDEIGDGVENAVDEVKDFFKGIFGKRSLRVKRSSPPSCDDFKQKNPDSCKYYTSPDQCAACGFSTAEDCPGYDAARAALIDASSARSWLAKFTDRKYIVNKLTIDQTKLSADGWSGVFAQVKIFGKEFSFVVNRDINPYVSDAAGPIVAAQALEMFKAAP